MVMRVVFLVLFFFVFLIEDLYCQTCVPVGVTNGFGEVDGTDDVITCGETIEGGETKRLDRGDVFSCASLKLSDQGHFRLFSGDFTVDDFQIASPNLRKTIQVDAGAILTLNLGNANNWNQLDIINNGTINIIFNGTLNITNTDNDFYNNGTMNFYVDLLSYNSGSKFYNDGKVYIGGSRGGVTYDGNLYSENTSTVCLGDNAGFSMDGSLSTNNSNVIYSAGSVTNGSCIRIGGTGGGDEIKGNLNDADAVGSGAIKDPSGFISVCSDDGDINIAGNNKFIKSNFATADDAGGVGRTCTSAACLALPVKFVRIYTQENNSFPEIVWMTSEEINNDKYIVESSIDGFNFSEVGVVSGSGNSDELLSYQFIDYSYSNGVVFYRIKQVDYDGAFDYSDVVVFTGSSNQEASVQVIPNPSNSKEQLKIYAKGIEEASALIIDELGRTLFSFNINSPLTSISPNLAAGVYLLSVNTGKEIITEKLIVE